ncbi:MAG: hypothetical protein AAF958_11010 [Planctomycetota bacterium]
MPDAFHIHLSGPERGAIPISFEAAAANLEAAGRVAFEPDGSFVWAETGGKQQIFGMLYDAAGQLQYVELRGNCSGDRLVQLVRWMLTGSDSPESLAIDLDQLEVVVLPHGGTGRFERFTRVLQSDPGDGPETTALT